MAKNLLPKIMYKDYNLPKVTALIHATLLVVLLSGILLWVYNIMNAQPISSYDDSVGIISFNSYVLSNNVPLMMAVGLLLGLNWLIGYLIFMLRKKPAAYSMSAVVLALQVALISSGITML